jgi:mono/diheme cytochrome c family protein
VTQRYIKEGGARFAGLNNSGTSNMPVYAITVQDQEIAAVIAFIKSRWLQDIRELQW